MGHPLGSPPAAPRHGKGGNWHLEQNFFVFYISRPETERGTLALILWFHTIFFLSSTERKGKKAERKINHPLYTFKAYTATVPSALGAL